MTIVLIAIGIMIASVLAALLTGALIRIGQGPRRDSDEF